MPSFAKGRRYSRVRRSLEHNMHHNPPKQLTSLIIFFTRIKHNSSSWYSGFGNSDTKEVKINDAIIYLNTCIADYNYPSEEKLLYIFETILRILPIVRSSDTKPKYLSMNTIDITSTAKWLFNQTVTQILPYEFEKIDGLSLDWIRDNRTSDDRKNYNFLLNKIAEFTAPNDLTKILPNFYEHKDKYYQLVTDAIAL